MEPIDELAVFNDEAHHIHDPRMAWFKSIQDIHHKMLQKDARLALQVDVRAQPAEKLRRVGRGLYRIPNLRLEIDIY